MENSAQSSPQVLENLKTTAKNMEVWLKLIGIVSIVSGALTALSIVGIIFAWLPIWMGVLLIQAASSASNAQNVDNQQELVTMLEKFRLYFIIQGILVIVGLAVTVLAIIAVLILGLSIPAFLDSYS